MSEPSDAGQIITGLGANGAPYPLEKMRAHTENLPHRAISVFIFDEHGRTLMQQRAAGKYHGGGLWANACCSHPAFGEGDQACAVRRLADELGLTHLRLFAAGRYRYRAPVGDLFENEDVALFAASLRARDAHLAPNPDEVQSLDWMAWEDALDAARSHSSAMAPWTRLYLNDRDVPRRLLNARDGLFATAQADTAHPAAP